MKKYIVLPLLLLISLCFVRTAMSQAVHGQDVRATAAPAFTHLVCQHGKCPFIYLVSVKQGSIKRLQNDEYQLTFRKDAITHVLSYKNAPFMLAHYTDSQCLRDDPTSWRADQAVFPENRLLAGNVFSNDMVFPKVKIKSIRRAADHVMTYTFFSDAQPGALGVGKTQRLADIVLVSTGVEQENKLHSTWAWGKPCHN